MSKSTELAASIHFKLDPSEKRKLRIEAAKQGLSLSDYIRQIIESRQPEQQSATAA